MPQRSFLFCICLLLLPISVAAQQVPDTTFQPQMDRPYYRTNHPVVGIDGAHHNFHTAEAGFLPFARLLAADGCQIKALTGGSALQDLDLLVIANPLHASNIGNWQLPNPSAFSVEEIEAIRSWVENGGSLLLIADHMPFAGAAGELAQAFGFRYENGFVMGPRNTWPPDQYHRSQGHFQTHPVLEGIDSLGSFTGSALQAPAEATVLITFPGTHRLLLPEIAWQFNEETPEKPLEDKCMGAVLQYGKGRVACFTEAAMFTSQIIQNTYKAGFTAPGAPQNQAFILNLVHWLLPQEQASQLDLEVQQFLGQLARHFEDQEMQALSGTYASNAVIYEPTGAEIRGEAAIEAYWMHLKDRAISWQSEVLETEQIGDQVLVVALFSLTYKNDEGRTVEARSKAMLTLERQAGGFRILRDFYFPIRPKSN